jgi:hypothetical protein
MVYRKAKPSRKKHKKPIFKRRLIYGTIAIAIIIAVFFTYSSLRSSNQTSDGQTHSKKAAIVDQLSISNKTRNDAFKQESLSILSASGFNVTYYSGENVTVDFYKKLPKYGYSLIVFRVHAAAITNTTWVGMFTSELYNESKYPDWLSDNYLAIAQIFEGNETYFGITPRFVQYSMGGVGRFVNTTIIMMGCDGLKYNTMAEAFVSIGAKVYISWDGTVSVSYTDQSTILLLKSLLEEKQTIRAAIEEIDPDPDFKGKLDYYPADAGGYKLIPDTVGSLAFILQAKGVFVKFWELSKSIS